MNEKKQNLDVEEICEKNGEKGKEWLEKICEIYGEDFKWPPYPDHFQLPGFVKNQWTYRGKSKILHIEKNVFFSVGDKFNAVALPKKRKRGHKYSERLHRIHQFQYSDNSFLGYVDLDRSYFEKGQIVKDLVYRFEIVYMHKRIIYCRPIINTFNRDNLLDNLVNCYYEKTLRDNREFGRKNRRLIRRN